MIGARTPRPRGKLRAGRVRPPRATRRPALAAQAALSYDAHVPQPSGRSCRPPRARRPRPKVPCPRSARSAPSASIRPTVGDLGARGRPAVRRHRRRRARAPARPPPGERRPPGPARRRSRRRARRPLPARRPDARRVALRRDAAQGPASVGLRLRADLPRPRHGRRADRSAGSSRGCASSRSGRSPASCRTSGRWPAPRRTATSCCARPASTRARSSACTTIRGPSVGQPAGGADRAAPPDVDVIDDDGVRHRLWVVPGRRRRAPTSVATRHSPRPARGPVTIADGHHRYETALRYRDERRMTPLVRGGPGVRLPADAAVLDADGEPLTVLPTHRVVRGLGAATAAGLLDRAERAVRRRAATCRRRRSRRSSRRPGWRPGGEGRFGLWTRGRRGAPDRPARRLRAVPAGRRRRRCARLDVIAPRRSRSSACSGIDAAARRRWRRIGYTKSAAEADRRGRWRHGRRRRRVPARADAGRRRSRRSPATATSCPRSRPTSTRRPSPASSSTRTSGEPVCTEPDPGRDPRPAPSSRRSNGRPVRKDEIELHERGLYIESWLPERRSRRKPLLFVHGELAGSWLWERYLGYFAGRGWEGHALNLRNHFWSQTADPATLSFETYTEDVVAALERLGPTTVVVGHGMGGLLALKAAERMPVSGLVLIGSELPRELRAAGPAVRAARDPRGLRPLGHRLGDAPREAPARPPRPDPRRRAADPAPARPEAARGRARPPPDAGRRAGRPARRRGRPAAGHRRRPRPDRPVDDAERLAEWLDAEYEPFGAHSHYGLVLGEHSYQQVAEAIRAFLETNRL